MAPAAKLLCPFFRTPTSARSRGRSTGAKVGPALVHARRRCGRASLRFPSSTDASEDSDLTFVFVWSSFLPFLFSARAPPHPTPLLYLQSFFCLLPNLLPLSDD